MLSKAITRFKQNDIFDIGDIWLICIFLFNRHKPPKLDINAGEMEIKYCVLDSLLAFKIRISEATRTAFYDCLFNGIKCIT